LTSSLASTHLSSFDALIISALAKNLKRKMQKFLRPEE
jgi:hypothetical protein